MHMDLTSREEYWIKFCVGTSHSVKQTPPTVQQNQEIFLRYSLQPGHQDTGTSATQPVLIAEIPVLTG
jgi:hypothetical protein